MITYSWNRQKLFFKCFLNNEMQLSFVLNKNDEEIAIIDKKFLNIRLQKTNDLVHNYQIWIDQQHDLFVRDADYEPLSHSLKWRVKWSRSWKTKINRLDCEWSYLSICHAMLACLIFIEYAIQWDLYFQHESLFHDQQSSHHLMQA